MYTYTNNGKVCVAETEFPKTMSGLSEKVASNGEFANIVTLSKRLSNEMHVAEAVSIGRNGNLGTSPVSKGKDSGSPCKETEQSASVPQLHETNEDTEIKTCRRLQTYPIVVSWVRINHWIPAFHIVRPRLLRMAYSDLLLPVTIATDTFLNQLLIQLEEMVPSIKTLRMRDIRNKITDNPIKKLLQETSTILAKASIVSGKVSILSSGNGIGKLRRFRRKNIAFTKRSLQSQPPSQLQLKKSENYSRLPLDIDEALIVKDTRLSSRSVQSGEATNKVSHSSQRLDTAISEPRPVLDGMLSQISKTHSTAVKYMTSTYYISKKNRGHGKVVVVIATLETIRRLMSDGRKLATSSTITGFLCKEPIPREHGSNKEETRRQLKFDKEGRN